ncbi:hypothetical protein [Quadrisphaera sp. DSM 44207]|uniref:hypothetical protein n=1 Tax=Quadrisphaera sp. DSM 44207 TaxID=1881057 RepID=UPI0008817C07|nr:hypothetical protein [Quadrisphaera sp. DSM 44207]SDQ07224.1 hypothetical protein SAMN05428996_0357 [Quadrisphaera sp. DSM 44207]
MISPTHPHPEDDAVMGLLAERVPLSLLCDLGTRGGPDSAGILAAEGRPERPWWVQAR